MNTYVTGTPRDLPTEIQTQCLLRCERCHKPKVKVLDGNWPESAIVKIYPMASAA